MSISILNNPASLAAQNQLGITNTNLQKALYQLSSGSRINTGADDAAGLAVADGLLANITALTQSARNASDGVGKLQVADGALAQVTTLLNRAITLATESANGTLSDTQRSPLQAEFASIKAEIDRIGATTNFNGQQVFQNTTVDTYVSGATNLTTSTSLGGSAPITHSGAVTGATNLTGSTGATWTSTVGALTGATTLNAGTITIALTTPGSGANASYAFTVGQSYTGAGGNPETLTTVSNLEDIINQTGEMSATLSGGNIIITGNGAAVGITDTGATIKTGGAAGTTGAGTAATVTVGTVANQYTYTYYGNYTNAAGGAAGTVNDLVAKVNADARYTASLPGSGTYAGDMVVGWGTQQAPNGTTYPNVAGGGLTWTSGGGAKTVTVQPFGALQATTFSDTGSLTVGALITDIQNMGLSASLVNGSLVVGDPNNPNNAPTIGGTATGSGVLGANGTGTASVAADTNIYLTDDSANPSNTVAVAIGALSSSSINGASLSTDNLSTQTGAQSALTDISTAINDVAALRGTLGSSVNRLQSATNVINNNIQNLTSAQDQIRAADIPSTVASMAKYSILEQTGVAALAQANQMQQLVLKLIG